MEHRITSSVVHYMVVNGDAMLLQAKDENFSLFFSM